MKLESKTTKRSIKDREFVKLRIKHLMSNGAPLSAIPYYCSISETLTRKLFSELITDNYDEFAAWGKPNYEVVKAGISLKTHALFEISADVISVKIEKRDAVVFITTWEDNSLGDKPVKVTKRTDGERDDLKNAVSLHLLEGVPLSAIPKLCNISDAFARTLHTEIAQEHIAEIASWPKPKYEIVRAGSKLKDIKMLGIEDSVTLLKIESAGGGFIISPFYNTDLGLNNS